MKQLAVAGVAIVALIAAVPSQGADLPARTPYYKAPVLAPDSWSWAGFYIGGHAGYGWARGGDAFTGTPPVSTTAAFAAGQIPTFLNTDPKGFIGGGQAGYNWQLGARWLVGLEADFSGADIKGRGFYTFPGAALFVPATTTVSQSLDWLATVRGRVGFTFDRLLVYGTGGVAFGEVKNRFFTNAPGALATISGDVSRTKTGWVAGAGAEYAWGRNWSVSAQWLHYDLGREIASGPGVDAGVVNPSGLLNATSRNSGDVVWAALNYRFGAGPVIARD